MGSSIDYTSRSEERSWAGASVQVFQSRSSVIGTCEDTETRDRDDEGKEHTTGATEQRPAEIKRDSIASRDSSLVAKKVNKTATLWK